MFGYSSNLMNESCKNILRQLCQGMKTSQIYAGLDISFIPTSEGMVRIHQEEQGMLVNNFDFYPNSEGWIDSIAIYGRYLDAHYRTISASMEIFGLKVSDITYEGSYIDIELDQEQFPD